MDKLKSFPSVSHKQAVTARNKLNKLDLKMLQEIASRKVMTTAQLVSVCFDKSNRNNLRVVQRRLARPRKLKIAKRKSVQLYGNKVYTYQLTALGTRTIVLYDKVTKLPVVDKTYNNYPLAHTIKVNEAERQLRQNTSLQVIEHEPKCWRKYAERWTNKEKKLRPDLFAKFWVQDKNLEGNRGYTYHRFIEVDRETENLGKISEKAEIYAEYWRRTNKESWLDGRFPVLLWVVPNEGRKNVIEKRLVKDHAEYANAGAFEYAAAPELSAYLRKLGKS
jgi:hypothetical protein